MRTLVAVVVAFTFLLAGSPQRAEAAAPWFIVVEGSLLDEPVVLDDWRENQELLLSDEPPLTATELVERPSLTLRPLWGPSWEHYPHDRHSLANLIAAEAPVAGRFYPAIGDRPAVFTLHGAVHREGSQALAALARRGVPMRVELTMGDSASSRGAAVSGPLALIVAAALLVTAGRRASRRKIRTFV